MLPVALAGTLLSAASPAGAVTTAEPSITVLSPVADSTIPLGDVSVRMAVDLGDEASGRVDVTLGTTSPALRSSRPGPATTAAR